MSVVSQLLGEAATDAGGDEEWMYAVGDGDAAGANDGRAGPRIQRRLGAADAAAIRDARSLLRAQAGSDPLSGSAAATAVRKAAQCRDDDVESATNVLSMSQDVCGVSTSPLTTGRMSGTGHATDRTGDSHLPLTESNGVFMLLGDIARMRERGATVSASVQQQLTQQLQQQQQLGSSVFAAAGSNTETALLNGSGTAHLAVDANKKIAPTLVAPTAPVKSAAAASVALDEKVSEVEAALRRWEAKCTNATVNIAAVRQLLLHIVLGA
jgi:hypothetical protein